MTIRGEKRGGEVLITVGGAPLDWRSSLAVRNHSPTGPAWGWSVIAPIEADRWALDAGDVLDWLESAAAGTDGVVRLAVKT